MVKTPKYLLEMARVCRYYIDFIDNLGKTSRVYFFPKRSQITPLNEMVEIEYDSVKEFIDYLKNNKAKILFTRSIKLPMLAKHLKYVCNYFVENNKVHLYTRILTRKIPVPDLYTYFEILLQPLKYNGVNLEGGFTQFAEAYLKTYTGFVYNRNIMSVNIIPTMYHNYNINVESKTSYDALDEKAKAEFDKQYLESHKVNDSIHYFYYTIKNFI